MSKKSFVGMMGAAAMLAVVGAGPFAFAKGPSGNMNLRLNGYETVTGSGQVSILAIGQVISDTGGIFSGSAVITATDPSTPETDACAVSITDGKIIAPTASFSQPDGLFTISLTFGTTSAGTFCGDNNGATVSLACNRTLVHKNLVEDLDAGQYHCVVTGITGGTPGAITGESMEGHLDIVSGSNSPQS